MTTTGPKRRLRGLAIHFAAYFIVCAVFVAASAAVAPGADWFLLPVVGWGAVLALHVAYVMGLFDVFSRK